MSTAMTNGTVSIPAFFRGPATTANGGYAAGLAAALLGGPAQARLRRPPPLDRPLRVARSGHGVQLFDGDELVVEAQPAAVDLDVPLVDLDAVRAAVVEPGLEEQHMAPGCVVCGPARDDGFRLFPGQVTDGIVGCSWTTPGGLTRGSEALPAEVVWAALDCPGGWALLAGWDTPEFFPALVQFAVDIRQPVAPAHDVLVLGWRRGSQGREHRAGSALLDGDGAVLAVAEQVCYAMPTTWAR